MRLPLILAASLVSLPAFAQQPQQPPSVQQYVDSGAADVAAAQAKIATVVDVWRQALPSLANQRDAFKAQVDTLTTERDAARAELKKMQDAAKVEASIKEAPTRKEAPK
jgi:hypothetical protein